MTTIPSPYANIPTEAKQRLYLSISQEDYDLLFGRRTGLFILHGARSSILEILLNKLADHVRHEHTDLPDLDPTTREERLRLILSRTSFRQPAGN